LLLVGNRFDPVFGHPGLLLARASGALHAAGWRSAGQAMGAQKIAPVQGLCEAIDAGTGWRSAGLARVLCGEGFGGLSFFCYFRGGKIFFDNETFC
jgi:hypothetical protein